MDLQFKCRTLINNKRKKPQLYFKIISRKRAQRICKDKRNHHNLKKSLNYDKAEICKIYKFLIDN